MRKLLLALAVIGALIAPASAATAAPAAPQDYILDQVNAVRADHGLRALKAHSGLDAMAATWSSTMAKESRLYHNPQAGKQTPSGWRSWAENVAYAGGYSNNAEVIFTNWMNSPGHRANILNGKLTHIGIGIAVDRSGRMWATQNFAQYPASAAAAKPAARALFHDVPAGAKFKGAIEWMARTGITNGYADGGFHPRSNVTRYAMAAFLYRYSGDTFSPARGTQTFPDVPPSHPFYREIEWMANEGITTGYADGRFRPGSPVTRQTMAAFLHRLSGSPRPTTSNPFNDVSRTNAFRTPIDWMAQTGVTTGYADGGFHPASPVVRQEMTALSIAWHTSRAEHRERGGSIPTMR